MELESLTESELFNCSFLFSFTFVSAFYSILSTPYQTSYLPNFQSSHFAEPPALTHPISPRWGFGFLLLLFSINISSLPGFAGYEDFAAMRLSNYFQFWVTQRYAEFAR